MLLAALLFQGEKRTNKTDTPAPIHLAAFVSLRNRPPQAFFSYVHVFLSLVMGKMKRY